jgi:hypothetical protein
MLDLRFYIQVVFRHLHNHGRSGTKMKKGINSTTESLLYEIKVQGALDGSWSDWFSGMAISYIDGVTTLRGEIKDQSILRGILSKIWDLNLTLISINQVNRV